MSRAVSGLFLGCLAHFEKGGGLDVIFFSIHIHSYEYILNFFCKNNGYSMNTLAYQVGPACSMALADLIL